MSERDAERSVSQTVRAQLALRDMILSGRLRPGERISELQAVDITGVSRTPVRLALVRLEDEGLLQAIPSGGFMVKAFSAYVTMNARFHALLNELSASAPLIREIDRVSALPFASPSAFVMAQSALPEAHQILLLGQDHHRIVVDAIENREGARAEAVMREHSRLAARNLRLAIRNRTHLELMPALALLKSSAE